MAVVVVSLLSAHTTVAQPGPAPQIELVPPAPEPNAIPLYGDAKPGSASTETWMNYVGHGYVVRNVTRPTLTPFLPDPAKANGAAVIVAPGGAFMLLALEPEGWKVARALADRGIAAFVLKYRVMPTPVDIAEATALMDKRVREGLPDPRKQPLLQYPPSTHDALAALAMVRAGAKQWGIDPERVGMIGFSAGAMTSLNTVMAAKPGTGPDFFGYIYGPQADVPVPADAPPMFAAIALDDPLFPSMGFPIVEAWHKAKRPVELHAYGRGGHGFGLGIAGTTTALMLDQFVAWMAMQEFGGPQPSK
ncbi:MAG: alpha/beta hydrolase [Novosphingobium sp.]|nr:alpha/beta hydrolase [Novosphingobium sp.]